MSVEQQDDRETLAVLSRHFVGLAFHYQSRKGLQWTQDPHFEMNSGFILEHNDRWFLATAGHVVHDWNTWIKNDERRIISQSLAYGLHSVETANAIPFDFFQRQSRFADEEHRDLDYALVLLTDDDVEQLLAQEIQPLTINSSRTCFDSFEGFCVIGLPGEFSKSSEISGFGHAKLTLIPLCRENPKPVAGGYWNLTARVTDMGSQKQIDGMSGGPVFGFWTENGETKYEVVAIQSRWAEKTARILAFLLTSVFDHVQDLFDLED
jgi:hypothetical protein